MARYDAQTIHELAGDLEDEAARSPVLGALVGAVLGAAASGMIFHLDAYRWLALLVGALVSAGLGAMMGRQHGCVLKAQAQTMLCQIQIERNTHKEKTVVVESPSASRREAPQKAVLSRPTQQTAVGGP